MSYCNLFSLDPEFPDFDEQQTKKVVETANLFCQELLPGMGIDFNVFDWSKEEQIGIFIGIFLKTNLIRGIPGIQQLYRFAINIAKNYLNNPYHSFYHAVDVAYVTYYMIEDLAIGEQIEMTQLDKSILYISAIAHDVLHPGTNNLYQVNAKTPIAKKYDNISVLENQSADFVRKLLNESLLLENLNGPAEFLTKEKIIDRICDCILKTDMIYHFRQLDTLIELTEFHLQSLSFVQSGLPSAATSSSSIFTPQSASIGSSNALNNPSGSSLILPSSSVISTTVNGVGPIPVHTQKTAVELFKSTFNISSSLNPNQNSSSSSLFSLLSAPVTKVHLKTMAAKEQLMQIILHAAGNSNLTVDISNPIRPFIICKKWSDLVLEEFTNQGKMEMAAGLPISPNMDPSTSNQTQIQLSFTRLIVQPLFEPLFDIFIRTGSLMDLIADNIRQWGGTDIPVIKHRKTAEEKSRTKKHAIPHSKRASEGGRRLSFAAGTVEIPEALQKLLTKNVKPSRNSLRKASHLDGEIHLEKLDIEEETEDNDSSLPNSPSIGNLNRTGSAPNLTD